MAIPFRSSSAIPMVNRIRKNFEWIAAAAALLALVQAVDDLGGRRLRGGAVCVVHLGRHARRHDQRESVDRHRAADPLDRGAGGSESTGSAHGRRRAVEGSGAGQGSRALAVADRGAGKRRSAPAGRVRHAVARGDHLGLSERAAEPRTRRSACGRAAASDGAGCGRAASARAASAADGCRRARDADEAGEGVCSRPAISRSRGCCSNAPPTARTPAPR